MTTAPLLSIRGIKKSFGGVRALVDGCLELNRGEILALCGGNGAGKSTILKVLMGFIAPDQGEILIDGRKVRFADARQALDAGIAIVQQELSAVPHLTVAENIYLGAEPRRFGFVDFRELNRRARELLASLGFDIDPTATMDSLSVAAQQLVEIAKALSHADADILIFDEPTSALSEKDSERLFDVLRGLAAAGKGIIYVTHRLAEIFNIATHYTVFKDGAYVTAGRIADITRERLIEMMIGGAIQQEYVKENVPTTAPLLEVRGLTRRPWFSDVSFALHRGEVLGIYGLVGSGRTELLDTIFGLRRADAGAILMEGRAFAGGDVAEAIGARLGYVTEDRKRSGLVLSSTVGRNLSLAALPRLQRGGFIHFPEERSCIARAIRMMNIKAPGPQEPVQNLSGGNQQKVVLGRSILTDPLVLLLDEPTRGVDVGAKKEIYRFISGFAQAGGAVLMVSSELEEILGMSDRTIVLCRGQVNGQFHRTEATQKKLMMAAA
ncbi:ribose ABC transporter ATP binding subunit [Rhodovastum atsumiense]|uniref:Sugar ABC transporter ATP-binding protein n=1 Tax=Rhodovastum atsumiense TaxID=504468 RepID=A0A5M6IRZ9_9PROT|nr:sugar ABC transporter ATP-binding protein [Rhodovastum atsumiense]KAA5610689.1 sugar ABC transporter ATP-binding protein [Rhodovastum atsumiense]CAH2603312.1 ribose ABC transporter ATP binding subunit [Rhodovastum atsumiense]